MIEYLFNPDIVNLSKKIGFDAIGCEIISEIILYHGESHKYSAFFWHQDNKLFLSMRNSLLRISGEICDCDELLSFIEFISPEYILIRDGLIGTLPDSYKILEKGEVMWVYNKGKASAIHNSFEASPTELSKFFFNENMFDNIDSFLSDFSAANKNSLAAYSFIKRDNDIIAAAYSGRVTPCSAVINIVAVNKKEQRKGFGSKTLSELINKLSGRKLFVFKEQDKNTSFYKNFGFEFEYNFITLKRI